MPIQVDGIFHLPLKVTLIGCQFGTNPRKFLSILNIFTFAAHSSLPLGPFTEIKNKAKVPQKLSREERQEYNTGPQ